MINSSNSVDLPQQELCTCLPTNYAGGAMGSEHTIKEMAKLKTKTIDFGEIAPGAETSKFIEIKNTHDRRLVYNVQRCSNLNTMYQSFTFNKYNVSVDPGCSIQLKITYSPILEHDKSRDCFLIHTREPMECEKIFVKGKCLGTSIKCSTKFLGFTITSHIKKRVNTFELKNLSKIPATFQIDINDNEDLFEVNITNGQIQPKKSIYITITFKGIMEGLHYRRLVILVFKHEPIFIDLVGVYHKSRDYQSDLSELSLYPREGQSNYAAYFTDYGFSEENIGPYKQNQNYFDFGRILPNSYGKSQNRNNITIYILENMMQYDIMVKWYRDPDNIFIVYPSEMKIRPYESGYFEVSFNPDFKDHMYYKVMFAQIYWISSPRPNTPVMESPESVCEVDNVPLATSITLIGHSFPENQSWISAVEVIPSKITFPVCLPGHQSFTSFMLKSDGHLPILFKFIPPKKSRFEVKPLMGMMRFVKIFVAKLTTANTSEIYKEEWKIEINGEPQKTFSILFQGQSSIPSITIGNENTVQFNATLPGCQDIIKVPVKNISCYDLKVELIGKNEYFHANPSKFHIASNDEISTEWTFHGKVDVPTKASLKCSIRVISNFDEYIGLPYEVEVEVEANCEYSQICATPRYKDFGDLPWGSSREVQFKIYNFGKAAVCYILKAIAVSPGVDHDRINILNSKGKLCPNENNTIKVSFECQAAMEHVIQIVYFTRINESGDALTTHPPVDLFSMRYNCIHPVLQIEECVEHNLGRIFSKLDLWHIFSINMINDYLLKVREGEIKMIKIHLPSAECHDKIYKITFVLKNITKFALSVNLTRVRMCKCQPTEISKSLSFRQKVFNCPHRHMVTMKLSDGNIAGDSFQLLDIFINFNLTTSEEVAYDLKLAKDRHIQFCFQMNNISREMQKLSAYNSFKHKKFFNMFIGAKEPPYQTYWLYNNTSQSTRYELIDRDLNALNELEGFPVLSCYNNKGVVPPHSCKAILFRFHPIEAKKYQVILPLLLGPEKGSLKLSGRGTYKYDHQLINKFNSTMPKMSIQLGESPVVLSADYMVVEAFPVWSTIDKLIYIRNITKDKVMHYSWERCCIEGIIEITAQKPEGILQPEETLGILLVFKSLENPTISAINLSCKIINVTQNEIHKKSVGRYKERQQLVDQYFLIDEKGTHNATNDFKIEPPSEDSYVTLAIIFHTISTLEIPHYLEVHQFLGQNPLDPFEIEVDNFIQSLQPTSESKDSTNKTEKKPTVEYSNQLVPQIMECFIMDTLRSPIFQEMLYCQQKATPPYYIQFKQEDEKSKTKAKKAKIAEMKKHFAGPPVRNISETLKHMIHDSIEQIFF